MKPSKFKIGDQVYHQDDIDTLYEVVGFTDAHFGNLLFKGYESTGGYPEERFRKPSVYKDTQLFCKCLKVYCTTLIHSYMKDGKGREYIEVQYPDGSSCESFLDTFELHEPKKVFEPKFKKGDKLLSVYEITPGRTAACDSYLFCGTEFVGVDYGPDVTSISKKLPISIFKLEPKPFVPKFRKGDILDMGGDKSPYNYRWAAKDSEMFDGEERVSIDYTEGSHNFLPVKFFTKREPTFKVGDKIEFNKNYDHDCNDRIVTKDSYFDIPTRKEVVYYNIFNIQGKLIRNDWDFVNRMQKKVFVPKFKKGDVAVFPDGCQSPFVVSADSYLCGGLEVVDGHNVSYLTKYVKAD